VRNPGRHSAAVHRRKQRPGRASTFTWSTLSGRRRTDHAGGAIDVPQFSPTRRNVERVVFLREAGFPPTHSVSDRAVRTTKIGIGAYDPQENRRNGTAGWALCRSIHEKRVNQKNGATIDEIGRHSGREFINAQPNPDLRATVEHLARCGPSHDFA